MNRDTQKTGERAKRGPGGLMGLRGFVVAWIVLTGALTNLEGVEVKQADAAVYPSEPAQTLRGVSAVDSLIRNAVNAGYWAARSDDSAPGGWIRGPLYRLRAVSARDDRGLSVPGFAARDWAHAPADSARLVALQHAVRDRMAAAGFVFAEVGLALTVDVAGEPAVDAVVTVTRGAAFKMGEPVLRGTRTRPAVARRLALWDEEDNHDPARFGKGLARLRRLGYYESVEPEGLYRDSARNVLYPVLRLTDARANTIGGLLGYDTEAETGGRLTGFVDVRLVNMRGTARDFAFSFDGRTAREREVHGTYTEPWLFNLSVGARWEGRFLQQDTVFQEWQHSLFLFRDLDFTSRVEAEAGVQANHDRIAETRSRALLSGVRVLFDSRDRVPFTRTGTRANLGLTGVQRTLEGGDADSSYYLTRVQAGGERWFPVTERLGFKGGLTAATNYPLDRLNSGELYDLGGARSLRGYREREFRTNAYVLGDAELQWTVGRRSRVFGFTSPGLINRPAGRYDFRRVFGYGAGLEIAQGDWSVALAYALNPDRPLGNGFLHVAVENRF